MNVPTSRTIAPIGRPQVFGIAAVLVAFILVEFVVGAPNKAPVMLSNDAPSTTIR